LPEQYTKRQNLDFFQTTYETKNALLFCTPLRERSLLKRKKFPQRKRGWTEVAADSKRREGERGQVQ